MKRLLAVFALILSGFTAFGDDPDIVEGARRAAAYWNSTIFARCGGDPGRSAAWYALDPGTGSIQMVPELRIQFKTEELSQEQRLNGFEFKATTSVEPGQFRWWMAQSKSWRDWQVGEIAPPAVLIKKKGVWSQEMAPNRWEGRKALTTCSQIPLMEDKH